MLSFVYAQSKSCSSHITSDFSLLERLYSIMSGFSFSHSYLKIDFNSILIPLIIFQKHISKASRTFVIQFTTTVAGPFHSFGTYFLPIFCMFTFPSSIVALCILSVESMLHSALIVKLPHHLEPHFHFNLHPQVHAYLFFSEVF